MKFHKAAPVEMEGQFRSVSDGTTTFEGYSAVFGQRSKLIRDDLSARPYFETLTQGTFARSLGDPEARKTFVVDHDNEKMISSFPRGPLRMSEDSRGLLVTSPWPRTDYADNVRSLYEAGEPLGMSILFATPRNGAKWNADYSERTVTEAFLKHVSVLATMEPAYDGTVANFRALAELTEADVEDVDALMEALRTGRRLDEGEYNLLTRLTAAVAPETDVVPEPETDAERAATDKWIARVAEINPKS